MDAHFSVLLINKRLNPAVFIFGEIVHLRQNIGITHRFFIDKCIYIST